MLGISIIAYNRPKCLYVTLDSLTRVLGIERCYCLVSFDGINDVSVRQNFSTVIEDMLQKGLPLITYQQESNVGILYNRVSSIRRAFNLEVDEVIFIEDDHLVCSDVLKFLDCVGRKDFWISLCGVGGRARDYRPKGNLITRSNFEKLEKWIEEESYIGLYDEDRGRYIDRVSYRKTHDAIFYAYMLQHPDVYTCYSDIPYLAHFGVFGSNTNRGVDRPDLLDLENRMFRGHPGQWLDNIARIFEQGDFPSDSGLSPSIFRYR